MLNSLRKMDYNRCQRMINLLIVLILIYIPDYSLTSGTCGELKMDSLKSKLRQFEMKEPSIRNSNHNSTRSEWYYRYMTVDEKTGSLFIGAMNYIIRLNLKNIEDPYIPNKIKLQPNDVDISRCSLEAKPVVPDCQNHIRYIGYRSDDQSQIYFCGSNALTPQGYSLKVETMQLTNDGRREECQSDAFQGSTAVYVTSGNPGDKPALYIASSSATAFIYRPPLLTSRDYMSSKDDNKWLNGAQFVASFDVGDMVFFFFREVAMEITNCEKRVFSRVGKVCKNDLGGAGSILHKEWTSFQKARLNCSIPGNFPAYFDEIQDVYRVNNTFYGLFTTNVNGISASAICAFTLDSINKAFAGKYKSQKDAVSNWLPVMTKDEPSWKVRPPKCNNESKSLDATTLSFISKNPLMDEAVQHLGGAPLFYEMKTQMKQLEVAHNINQKNKIVFFASTTDGKLYKIFLHRVRDSPSVVSSIYEMFDTPQTIWSMKLVNESIYVGTDSMVKQMNIVTCSLYTKIDTCVYDPYCAWMKTPPKCVKIQQTHYTQPNLYVTYENLDSAVASNSLLLFSPAKKVRNISSLVVMEINYMLCMAQYRIKWQFQGEDKVLTDITSDNSYRLTDNNALIIYNIQSIHKGNYTAVTTIDNQQVVLAQYDVEVLIDQHHIEREWIRQFEEWCDYFDEQKRLSREWKNTCGSD